MEHGKVWVRYATVAAAESARLSLRGRRFEVSTGGLSHILQHIVPFLSSVCPDYKGQGHDDRRTFRIGHRCSGTAHRPKGREKYHCDPWDQGSPQSSSK